MKHLLLTVILIIFLTSPALAWEQNFILSLQEGKTVGQVEDIVLETAIKKQWI